MLKFRITGIAIIAVCFLLALDMNVAFAGQCVFPSIPKQVTFQQGWHGKPELHVSSELVDQGGVVDLVVVSSGLPLPPYSWSLAGSGFDLDKWTTDSDAEPNKLIAYGSACGSAGITVKDFQGNEDTEYVRSTAGKWVHKGGGNPRYEEDWSFAWSCDPYGFVNECAGNKYIHSGKSRWIIGSGCAYVADWGSYWVADWGLPLPPTPPGGTTPLQCSKSPECRGEWNTICCGAYNGRWGHCLAGSYDYYEWECQ